MEEEHEDHTMARPSKRRRVAYDVQLKPSQLVSPKSAYQGWKSDLDPVPELEAIWRLECEREYQFLGKQNPPSPLQDGEEYKISTLSEFSIYGSKEDGSSYEPVREFVPLHRLQVDHGVDRLFFDGIVRFGSVRKYIQHAPFKILTLEGYGDNQKIYQICIQSEAGAVNDVWYSLGEPAAEYRRYHEAFLWIAEFAKHFVDYLSNHAAVHIENLRKDFYHWLYLRYDAVLRPSKWFSDYGHEDFRQAFVAYSDFLWKEACAIHTNASSHPIWAEADPKQLGAIKEEQVQEQQTVVSPYVYECFSHMYFKELLERQEIIDPDVKRAHDNRKAVMGFTKSQDKQTVGLCRRKHSRDSGRHIKIGSVVVVARDEKLNLEDTSTTRYGYVQGITTNQHQRCPCEVVEVIWLYRPEETILVKGKYPWRKELFLSDDCNCGKAEILTRDVLYSIDIEWFGLDPNTSAAFFVRQVYCTEDNTRSFRKLRQSDFKCNCRNKKSALQKVVEQYKIGDPVLVQMDHVLEPCILESLEPDSKQVLVRQLERLKGKIPLARPNELCWTEERKLVKANRIIRKCHMRVYTIEERDAGRIPPPYGRDGVADCWYISAEMIEGRLASDVFDGGSRIRHPLPFNESFDPLKPVKQPLRMLDLFCGGGFLGRGIAESGIAEVKYGIDKDKQAIHTWLANKREKDAKAFWGSVNDVLAQAMKGMDNNNIPRIGDIHLISGGSPCQGHTNLQADKKSVGSKRNSSMVASLMAYFDFYRPQFGVIENVLGMANDIDGQNVFVQVLCALVGMGYQTQAQFLHAWSCGDSQSRSRVFIIVAAPGLDLPHRPAMTHADPPRVKPRRRRTANDGRPLRDRGFQNAHAFNCMTAKEATGDLPDIEDAQMHVCIPYPDHRVSRKLSIVDRCLITSIPTLPRGMNLAGAKNMGLVSQDQIERHVRRRKGQHLPTVNPWKRLKPKDLFPTVATSISPWDFKTGPSLHWDQHRLLTIMEARRAQGIPDDEVLIGLPSAQYRMVGNGVARGNALALGMSIREAWLASVLKS